MSTTTSPHLSALLTLLPTYTPTTLPPQLLHKAQSLHTLSHQRARHLKPDEEIARSYACAEIAVDRLRSSLRLPPKKTGNGTRRGGGGSAVGGPPCPPATYRKLLVFLDGVLKEGVGVVAESNSTPEKGSGKRKRVSGTTPTTTTTKDIDAADDDDDDDAEEVTQRPVPKRPRRTKPPVVTATTPTITASAATRGGAGKAGFVGKVNGTKKKRPDAGEEEAPSLVTPAIRALCRAFDTPSMSPHVYTGACVVLREAGLWPPPDTTGDDVEEEEEGEFEKDVTALVVALYLMVLTRMMVGSMSRDIFDGVVSRAGELCDGEEGGGFKGEKVGLGERVEGWVRQVSTEGWCKGMEWFEGVPEEVLEFELERGEGGHLGEDEERTDEEMDVDGESGGEVGGRKVELDAGRNDPEGVLLPGLGTMVQDAVDWTSEERRRKFEIWKKGIEKRLQGLEKGKGSVKKMARPSAGGRSIAVH